MDPSAVDGTYTCGSEHMVCSSENRCSAALQQFHDSSRQMVDVDVVVGLVTCAGNRCEAAIQSSSFADTTRLM